MPDDDHAVEGLSNLAEQFNMKREEIAGKIVGLTVGRHRDASQEPRSRVSAPSLLFGTVFSHLLSKFSRFGSGSLRHAITFSLPCF